MNDLSDYEKMLDAAKKKLPEIKQTESRLEIPRPSVQKVGRQTVIRNFSTIAKVLRREPEQMAKYLFKELAVPGTIKGNELVLMGKLNEDLISKRILDYVKEYVTCNECKKLDTSFVKREKTFFIRCEACGASRPIKRV
ncbi:translation initiation factor IF-2 subunit beta [Candidatus Aenigmatarchaeota archaeon]